tara:strand:+ start:12275 stop:12760 length:486 start_codon:yes stop_codon:yes gene_type:complete
MPRNPKGEMNLADIRSLVRQHNKLQTITGVDTKSRAALVKELVGHGYKIDHENKKIVKAADKVEKVYQGKKGEIKSFNPPKQYTRKGAKGQTISVGKEGERKPQKRTVAKQKRKAFAKEEIKKVNPKTGKAKHPPIKPAIKKQKEQKAKSAKERKKLVGGD